MSKVSGLTPVPTASLPFVWIEVEPLLRKAVDLVDNKLGTEDIWIELNRGAFTLWLYIEEDRIVMAFVAHIVQHPKCRTLCVPYLGSVSHTIDSWLEQGLATLEEYGRMNDCKEIELPGRFGWKKFVEPFGYKPKTVLYYKDIKQ